MYNTNKPIKKYKRPSEMQIFLIKDAWNAAIEAAAKLIEDNNTGTASTNQIRGLKK